MKNIILNCLLLSVFVMLFSSCGEVCERERTYLKYSPVYKTETESRVDISMVAAKNLENVGKIYTLNEYLFVNELKEGVHIIDNSNPSSPNNIGFLKIEGNVDIAIKDGILYADSYLDLLTINIQDPLNPQLLKRTENVFDNFYTQDGNRFVIDYTEEIATEITHCSEASWFEDDFGNIFVNADANTPSFSSTEGGGPNFSGVGAGGSLARFTIGFDHLYTLDDPEIDVYSLSNPECPEVTSSVFIDYGIETVFPFGEWLFIGAQNGMHVLSVMNPATPERISSFFHATACDPVVVNGEYAYVTLHGGTECNGFENQLDVINIEDINNPYLERSYPLNRPHGLAYRENVIYVCDEQAGLKIMDASNPLEMTVINDIKDIVAYDVIAQNNGNLIIRASDGIYQYKATNPNELEFLSFLE